MTERQPLRVVLCWHMHQPQYQDLLGGEHLEPWTYLHGIKDYVDMAVHLEATPGAAAVVNFSPVLLEQIADFNVQLSAHLRSGAALRNRVLALLAQGGVPTELQERERAVRACLRVNRQRLVERFAPFKELVELADGFLEAGTLRYASEDFLQDLAVWYHLAWLGETVRMGDPRAEELMAHGRHFTPEHCRTLLEIIAEIIGGLIPRYRRLFGSGQVELSVTPYGHPIVPLIIDFATARDAVPQMALPSQAEYPGGDDRARWHIARAVQVFTQFFGVRPQGCWPSEGSVSAETLELLEEFGFDWAASGEATLRNSLAAAQLWDEQSAVKDLHRPYSLPDKSLQCFFRNDGLSDLIGFTYSTWHGDDAAANLVERLERLGDALAEEADPVVSIILDGENAWEYYPFNAYFFLKAVYERLAEHPRIRLTTFSHCVAEAGSVRTLPRLVAGSWVYGNFSTWIGDRAKNRAWDLLCDAKHAFDRVVVEGALDEAAQVAAERQLGVCEGSDWCWWFGDGNPAPTVASFDTLYRHHLSNLYRLLGEEPPSELAVPINTASQQSGAAEHGGTMKRSS